MTRSRISGAMVRGKINIFLFGILFPLVRSTSVNGLKSHHFQFVKLDTTQRHDDTNEQKKRKHMLSQKYTHIYTYTLSHTTTFQQSYNWFRLTFLTSNTLHAHRVKICQSSVIVLSPMLPQLLVPRNEQLTADGCAAHIEDSATVNMSSKDNTLRHDYHFMKIS